MAAAQFHGFPPTLERHPAFAPEHMQHRGIVEGDRLAEWMAHPHGGRDRFLGVSIGLLAILAVPRQVGQVGAAKDADVRPGEQRQYGFRGSAMRADGRSHMVAVTLPVGPNETGCIPG